LMENTLKSGIRILMRMHRKKDGGTDKDRTSTRYVSCNAAEYDKYVAEAKRDMQCGERLYSSINARDIYKAIRLYKMQQIEADYVPHDQVCDFYLQTRNQFLSCLAKPLCAKTKYFLIDIDEDDYSNGVTMEGVVQELQDKGIIIIDTYDTPNGEHVITEPYNPSFTPHLEIKNDAMRLVHWV